jgi:tetratricopeptide (TPR) repeat protein
MNLYPEDYDIHVSYGNLLEKVDLNLAIDAYETAISIDQDRPLAYFNLGALYNNLGKDAYLAGLNEDVDQLADSLYAEATVYFRKAYVNMESAYELNPKFLPTIRALVQLANTLGLEEQSEYYKRKELEMRGF